MAPQQESDLLLKINLGYQSSNHRHTPLQPASYRLERSIWRGILGMIGSLLLLGFYDFICFNYLAQLAQNDIVPNTLDAR
jgi:hypothetical protein